MSSDPCPCGLPARYDACCGRFHRVELDPATSWTGLEVLGSTGGGLFDTAGTVAFRAHHRTGVVAEDSAFGRTGGRWFSR